MGDISITYEGKETLKTMENKIQKNIQITKIDAICCKNINNILSLRSNISLEISRCNNKKDFDNYKRHIDLLNNKIKALLNL